MKSILTITLYVNKNEMFSLTRLWIKLNSTHYSGVAVKREKIIPPSMSSFAMPLCMTSGSNLSQKHHQLSKDRCITSHFPISMTPLALF